jgi:hypothetical protein
MLETVNKVLENLKSVPTELLIVFALALGTILFVPADVAAILAIDGFRDSFRHFLGPAFILVACWLAARFLMTLFKPIQQWRLQRRRVQQLHALTSDEKGYLSPFIEDGRNTIQAPMEDGVAGGLLVKAIIYRASNVFDVVEGVPYNLQPWAREYLSKHPYLLEGAAGGPQTPRERFFRPRI